MRAIFLALSLCLPACVFAHKITGTYEVSGYDPLYDQDYTGTVVITKEGAIYTANWTFENNATAVGTGIRKNDTISFVFSELEGSRGIQNGLMIKEPDPESYGVQVYEIGDHTLKGPWVRFQGEKRGHEKLKKIHVQS